MLGTSTNLYFVGTRGIGVHGLSGSRINCILYRQLHTTPVYSDLFKSKSNSSFGPETGTQSQTLPYNTHPILKRIPKIFRPYASRFITAPVSHSVSFLILHELTAIIPLVGIWYALYKYPEYFSTYSTTITENDLYIKGVEVINKSVEKYQLGVDDVSEKMRLISAGASSYVIVKLLGPARIIVSIGLMDPFARWIILPIYNVFAVLRARFSKTSPTPKSTPEIESDTETIRETVKTKKVNKPRL
ncbi:uncharacterized protein RJT21DRAFT_117329 [Scheffersomyces amazonensis]|uniref:uncharacterized protein n=1 Tax=Scheffersomyces amazonensis TaxID=1078765 RepID=UPI00315DDAE3